MPRLRLSWFFSTPIHFNLHPRNPHSGRYDFAALCKSCPDLERFLRPNPKGDRTIDFSDSEAVLALNRALLAHFYDIKNWELPQGYLCPPIPGRADYIHYLADHLDGKTGVRVLDIGTGANCIYPIIGSRSYGWNFVGSETGREAIESAQRIVEGNRGLSEQVSIVRQKNPRDFFRGIIGKDDFFDLTMCNPPFYASAEEARKSNLRKVKNLGGSAPARNFGGQSSEIWCPGGELKFLCKMIEESARFKKQVGWFTGLVSKKDHLRPLHHKLEQVGASDVGMVEMGQGQKRSRFIAWSF